MTTISVHQIKDLAQAEAKNEIILETNIDTQLHITANDELTIISLPYGNKFDIIDGRIYIKKY